MARSDYPHVTSAKNQITQKFGVTDIGGYRPTSATKGSDHVVGLALDVMVPIRSQKGDDIAAWAIANAGPLSVKYVIWKQQIYNMRNPGWRPMSNRGSITQNHYDHVHISFYPNPGSGATTDPGPQAANASTGGLLSNPFEPFLAILRWITNADNWFRILYALAGLALVVVGLAKISGKSAAIRKVMP